MINIQHSLLAVAAVCIGMSAQAQSTSPLVINGGVSIKNLQVELTDLRSGDGIAPSFSPKVPGRSEAEVFGGKSDGSYEPVKLESNWVSGPGSLLGPLKFDLALGNGEASLSKLGGNVALDLGVLASSFESSVYGYNGSLGTPSGGGRFGGSYTTGGLDQWTLGAGSQVRISGTVYIDLHVNTDLVVGLTKGQILDVAASVNGSIGLKLPYGATYTDVLGGQSYQYETFAGQVVQRVSPNGSGSSSYNDDVQDIPFELIARNHGTGSVVLEFSAGFSGLGRWDLAQGPNPGGPITSVPEPGTWALALAGLAVAGAVARRPGRKRETA